MRHIDAPHFIKTKLLSYGGRGKGDLFGSHDLEDLLAVLNSRPESVNEVELSPAACREAILPRLRRLRRDPLFSDAVEGYLANDVYGQHQIVLARIDAILGEG